MEHQPEQDTGIDAAAAPEAGTAQAPDEALRAALQEAQDNRDGWLRAKAETENVRKRAAAEAIQARKFALENFAGELLAVKDSLEAAMTVGADPAAGAASVESYRGGMEITLRQLTAAFEKFNVTEINPIDQRFDPHFHQAISTVESDGEPNRVASVMQKGYALHDRVLRPALVIVTKARGS